MLDKLAPLKERFVELKQKFVDSEAYQQLLEKWNELDPKNQQIVRYSSLGGVGFLILLGVWITTGRVSKLRNEVQEKTELVSMLQGSAQELKSLNAITGDRQAQPTDARPNWKSAIEEGMTRAGLDPGLLSVGPEKELKQAPGTTTVEVLLTAELKRINLRQLIKIAHELENAGDKPMKVRSLDVQTEGGEGYLNAKLDVSGFYFKELKE